MELNYSQSKRLLSPEEMADLELQVCGHSGKTLLDLMQDVGQQVAAFILGRFADFKIRKKKILIICGPGNNGGDGFVAALTLLEQGFDAQVVLLASQKYSSELKHQIEVFQSKSIPFSLLVEHESKQPSYVSMRALDQLVKSSDLIVDCLLGTGQKGDPRDLVASVCSSINAAKKSFPELQLISVDVPTGIDCDSGQRHQPCLSPDFSLVVQHLKRGMVQSPAIECLGEVVLLDAGIELPGNFDFGSYHLLSLESELLRLKERARDSHKGNFGHVLVVGGSLEMPGASQLAALAAMRTGAGLVTQLSFSPGSKQSSPELMYIDASAGLGNELVKRIISRITDFSCLIVGPGLQRGESVTSFVFEILREVQAQNIPCVLDADGIYALAELVKLGVPLHLPSVVMTPHPGEAAQLLQCNIQQVQEHRYRAVEGLHKLCQSAVVLKGASSICFDAGKGSVNLTGGPFLATAGSGDVLAGMIAGFLAGGYPKLSAASLGVFLHGIAGELAHQVHGGPIIASDIIAQIPYSIGRHAQNNSQ